MKQIDTIKVAQVVLNFSIGGVTSVVTQLLTAPQEGVQQIIILLQGKLEKPPVLPENIRLYTLNYQPYEEYSLSAFAKIAAFPERYFSKIVDQLEEVYQKDPFDIFHFHGLPKDLLIGTLLKKKHPSLKLVYTDHEVRITLNHFKTLQGKLLKQIYKRFYNDFNVIAVSGIAQEISMTIGYKNKKKLNYSIENTISLNAYKLKNSYSSREIVRIVYVSRITVSKRQLLLPAVASILKEKYKLSDFEFTIIGPDELNGKLGEVVKEKGLTKNFNLPGARTDIAGLLADFDIGVFPSEREGLPIALLEKMAAGLPVVAADIPEVKNVIKNADEALLFTVNDAEDCAGQLYKLIIDKALRQKIGSTGRKAVEERYSQSLLQKYRAFYQKLLSTNQLN